ncbi:MAG: class I SAM-dependent methyltransferase [Bdellovibrionales bacterium]|nr:class I SAM-dependent methyltransferase [Bdellovibrionales bacterium]NQZ18077.1 class I SAM-dependent methyltransferase [Bdellovibrionales bacterium]
MNELLVSHRYNQNKEVEYYATMVRRGLYHHEKIFFTERLKDLPLGSKVLIVGGGCGREAFALHNMGYTVDVLDISSSMIQKGRKLAQQMGSPVNFHYSNLQQFESQNKYSFVFICTSLLNFIQGKENRLSFLKKAYDLLDASGRIAMEVDVFQYRGLHRFNIASRLLRWKLGSRWEKGDTVRSFYGKHNDQEQPLFYHFYQNSSEVHKEMQSIGFVNSKHKDDFFWGFKP